MFLLLVFETKGRSIEEINRALDNPAGVALLIRFACLRSSGPPRLAGLCQRAPGLRVNAFQRNYMLGYSFPPVLISWEFAEGRGWGFTAVPVDPWSGHLLLPRRLAPFRNRLRSRE